MHRTSVFLLAAILAASDGDLPVTTPIVSAGDYHVGALVLPVAGGRPLTLHLSLRDGAVVVAHGLMPAETPGGPPAQVSHQIYRLRFGDGSRPARPAVGDQPAEPAIPASSDSGFGGHVPGMSWWNTDDLRLSEGRLRGTLRLLKTGNLRGIAPADWAIDAAVGADGTLSGSIGGAPAVGRLRPAAQLDPLAADAIWPMYDGPDGARVAVPHGLKLVDDLRQARLVWSSEAYFGGGRNPMTLTLPSADGAPQRHGVYGGLNSPALAGGLLLFHTVIPHTGLMGRLEMRKDKRERTPARGDLVVLAIDAASGATRWRHVIPDSEPALYYDKHACSGNTGVVADGAYICTGWTGRVYAFDLATGARRWSTPLPGHAEIDAKLRAITGPAPWLLADYGRLVAAGGVVAAPARLPRGMVAGVDIATGAQRWTARGAIQRCVVDGAERFLLVRGTTVSLLDPLTGTPLWTSEALGTPWSRPAAAHGWYIGAVQAQKERPLSGRLAVYRIGATGLAKAWERDGFANVLMPGIDADHILLAFSNGGRRTDLAACDAATGTERMRHVHPYSKWDTFFVRCDDRILWVGDGTHSGMPCIWLDAATLQRLSANDWSPPVQLDSGYDEVWSYPPPVRARRQPDVLLRPAPRR